MQQPPYTIALTVDKVNSRATLHISGEIDLAARPDLEQGLLQAQASPAIRDVIIDMGRVTFLDAAGIGALVLGHTAAARNGHHLRIVHLHGIARRTIDIVGLTDLFDTTGNGRPGHTRQAPTQATPSSEDRTAITPTSGSEHQDDAAA